MQSQMKNLCNEIEKKILKHKKFITSMLMDSTVNKLKQVTLITCEYVK